MQAMIPSPSLHHTIWLRDQNAAFVYLPKVACTSWKIYLWQALGNRLPDHFDYRDVHNAATLPLPYVATMPAELQAEFNAGLRQGTILTYAVLREPRSRILSAYLDKIEHHRNPNSYFSTVVIPEIQRFANLASEQQPSFNAFLAWIANQSDRLSLNDHWRPMTSLLGTSEAGSYTQMWSMDNMTEAIQCFANLLAYEHPFPSRQQLGARQTFDSHSRLVDYFGEAEQALFSSIYAQDLSLYDSIGRH